MKYMGLEDLKSLELHEHLNVNDTLTVFKVVGGYIYRIRTSLLNGSVYFNSVFVPCND